MEATANVNRSTVHNDEALENLIRKSEFNSLNMYYQFCNSPICHEITALILPSNRFIPEEKLKVFSTIVRKSGIPGLALQYVRQSSNQVTMFAVTSDQVVKQSTTWDKVVTLLTNRQLAHEKRTGNAGCGMYRHAPLPKGKWDNPRQNYRFSNEARSIPGVRHIDTDGLLYCPKCLELLYVIEATSIGYNDPTKHKSTVMTQKLAKLFNAQPILIQHERNDGKHESPVFVTRLNEGNRVYQQSWDQFLSTLNTHHCQVS